MIRQLPQDQLERTVAAVWRKFPWGDSHFGLLVAHIESLTIENAELRERLAQAESTPFTEALRKDEAA